MTDQHPQPDTGYPDSDHTGAGHPDTGSAPDAAKSGKAKAAAGPIDGAAVLDIAISARALADALQKGVRRVAPRMTLEQLAALRDLRDSGTAGITLGEKRAANSLAALADLGLVSMADAEGTAHLTPAGQEVLTSTDAILGGVAGQINDRPKPMGGRATKIVKQTGRMVRSYLRDNQPAAKTPKGKSGKSRKSA